jgi:endonuclease YncB( thermonuclease family)
MTALSALGAAVVLVGVAAGVVKLADSVQPDTLSGRPRVIDGDTIAIGPQRIRLWGIDAPESAQECTMPWGAQKCGQDATRALRGLLAGREVVCQRKDTDRYLRMVAICVTADGRMQLNAEIVRQGWAIDYARYSAGAYRIEQDEAERLKQGIWAGTFVEPEEWRREHR